MSGSVSVRAAGPDDAMIWARLRTALWPEWPDDHPAEVASYFADPPDDASCFLVEDAGGEVMGFAEVGLRPFAEGCTTSPVAYLEGIYIEPGTRRAGAARALVLACEAWARSRGLTELASDRGLDNDESAAFHEAVGFDEVSRVVCYRKEL
ncbi:MAG: aminoglycoside 6'-N-acetyltransferase [Longimicrobiales bacterium]|nr:aminoglycoside 6'-N-acetyltransferase [Longimicrobiales bacterium]